MESCINHPDREGRLVCMKYNRHLCEECAECNDPKLYCKHRQACAIWFIHKEKIIAERKRTRHAA